MDQGNTDPNNPNPTPSQPIAPSNFGVDPAAATPAPAMPAEPATPPMGGSSWGNPGGGSAGAPAMENPTPAPAVNEFSSTATDQPVGGSPFGTPPASEAPTAPAAEPAAPTSFNPFSSATPAPEPTPAVPSVDGETAPTDLTSLASNPSEATSYVPPAEAIPIPGTAAPESLVATPSASTEPSQAVTSTNGGGFPRIIYIIGGIVLLVVIGASAYFIFGVGRPSVPLEGTSVPAVQQPATSPPPAFIPPSTSSVGLPGETATGAATPTGISAFDLLRQRQSATGTATPIP